MQDNVKTPTTVAILGAGIAGLACANSLQARGLKVRVFEENGCVGGRMSTRMGPMWQCDYGAQYFTAQSARFREELARWEGAGVAELWPSRLWVIEGERSAWRESNSSTKRYVGVPTMAAPAEFLAAALSVECDSHVDGLRREPQGWRLHILGRGWWPDYFDVVVFALPAPQAQLLLKQTTSALQELVGTVRMRPAWALMIHCDESFDPGFDGAFVNTGPIRWIARDLSKPHRKGGNMWLVHGTAQWSEAHLETPPKQVQSLLLEEFQKIAPTTLYDSTVHRWLYADTNAPLARNFLWDSNNGLGLCGDWLHEAKVEGAWCSAVDLANAIENGAKKRCLDIELISIEFASFLYEGSLSLRNHILRKPLGRSLDYADLKGEDKQLHFGIIGREKELIACVCVRDMADKHYKIRQMAVSKDYQRLGLGARLLRHVEKELVTMGAERISLHARESAISFYESLGFYGKGELFDEVGIPHLKMQKEI